MLPGLILLAIAYKSEGGDRMTDYEMIMMIDAYDPKTNEKAIVNAQAMTTIHVVDR